ncbi:unnamed protein product [Hermetia illucens]|uniref:Tachykinin n=1 Tax=Hermetia illucens TaxID=343691 RepID=A0A7R8V511_HERIL|nr:unnamed protein product [Hermetia illucens]
MYLGKKNLKKSEWCESVPVESFAIFQGLQIKSNSNGNFDCDANIGLVGSNGINDDFNENKGLLDLVASNSSLLELIGNSSGGVITVPDYVRNPSDLSISKRAPSGFMGMRGKKDDEYSDYVGQDPNFEERGPFKFGKIFGIFRKKPGKFPGMVRVKPNKRFPLGFTGVRGRKDLLEFVSDKSEMLLDALQRLQEQRGEQNEVAQMDYPFDEEFLEKLERLMELENLAKLEKRMPSGFVGMRGKKDFDYSADYVDEEKRAPMGFLGMRGKKDVSAQLQAQKRSSLAQLFGIRGKKQPLQPMEFRGKFVGVRDSRGSADEDSKVKRAPSGFVGMRGKKWPDSTNQE